MASPRRILVPNGLYHVFTCGTGPSPIFRDAGDHMHFDWTLGNSVDRYGWRVLLVVHMTTHVHLLVRTPQPNLDAGMQRTKSCHAVHFNSKYERRGALFDKRYGYRVIRNDLQLFRTVAYVARNPVDAGLCDHAAEWRWSTLGSTLRGGHTWPANAARELARRCGGPAGLAALVEERVDLADVERAFLTA